MECNQERFKLELQRSSDEGRLQRRRRGVIKQLTNTNKKGVGGKLTFFIVYRKPPDGLGVQKRLMPFQLVKTLRLIYNKNATCQLQKNKLNGGH